MAITFRPGRDTVPAADLTILVVALGIASAVELAILRLLTRTAIHIPALDQLQTPYAWLSDGGRYAYFVVIALLLPVLALLALRLGASSRLATAAVTLFVAAALGATFDVLHRAILDVATIVSIAMLVAAISLQLPKRTAAIPVASYGFAAGIAGLYVAMPSIADLGFPARQPTMLLTGAEYLAVAFAVTSPLLVARSMDRTSQWAGAGVGLMALLLFLGNGATMRFLLLWNAGLSGVLPGVVYAIAAGALALTVVALARRGAVLAAAGILLLITGGIGLQSTYQSGLVVAGLASFALALAHPATSWRSDESNPAETEELVRL